VQKPGSASAACAALRGLATSGESLDLSFGCKPTASASPRTAAGGTGLPNMTLSLCALSEWRIYVQSCSSEARDCFGSPGPQQPTLTINADVCSIRHASSRVRSINTPHMLSAAWDFSCPSSQPSLSRAERLCSCRSRIKCAQQKVYHLTAGAGHRLKRHSTQRSLRHAASLSRSSKRNGMKKLPLFTLRKLCWSACWNAYPNGNQWCKMGREAHQMRKRGSKSCKRLGCSSTRIATGGEFLSQQRPTGARLLQVLSRSAQP